LLLSSLSPSLAWTQNGTAWGTGIVMLTRVAKAMSSPVSENEKLFRSEDQLATLLDLNALLRANTTTG